MLNLRTIPKPSEGEFPPYAIMYMKLIPDDGRVLEHLEQNFYDIKELIYSLPEPMLYHRYAEDKWNEFVDRAHTRHPELTRAQVESIIISITVHCSYR